MENRGELLEEAISTTKHCYDPNKILWWNQEWIKKDQLNIFSSSWFH